MLYPVELWVRGPWLRERQPNQVVQRVQAGFSLAVLAHGFRPCYLEVMKLFSRRLTITLVALLAASHAVADPAALVVIRFNQPRIYFDQQLYSAVEKAVAVKPDVMFDVVSNAPVTGDALRDQQWITTASRNTQAVVAALQKIGVPAERLRVTGQTKSGLRYDETHIFVR